MVEESKKPTETLTDDQVNDLVDERIEARDERDYDRADAIYKKLTDAGIMIIDSAHETAWSRR